LLSLDWASRASKSFENFCESFSRAFKSSKNFCESSIQAFKPSEIFCESSKALLSCYNSPRTLTCTLAVQTYRESTSVARATSSRLRLSPSSSRAASSSTFSIFSSIQIASAYSSEAPSPCYPKACSSSPPWHSRSEEWTRAPLAPGVFPQPILEVIVEACQLDHGKKQRITKKFRRMKAIQMTNQG
jgi:hypothetical protein